MEVTSLGEVNEQLRPIEREIAKLEEMLVSIKLAGVKDKQQMKSMADEPIKKTNFILENARLLELRKIDLKNIISLYDSCVNRLYAYNIDIGSENADAAAELIGRIADKRNELNNILAESEKKALNIDIGKLVDAHKKEAENLEKSITDGRCISRAIQELRFCAPVKIKRFNKIFGVVQKIDAQYSSEEGGILDKKQRLEEMAKEIIERVGKTAEQILATERRRTELEQIRLEKGNESQFPEERTFLYDVLLKGGEKARQTFSMGIVDRILGITKKRNRDRIFT